MAALDEILSILTGKKVFDESANTWRVYDALGNEIVNASGILLQGLHGFLLRQYVVSEEVAFSGGYQTKRKRRRKEEEPPTEDQITAERIRLGIIEARKERAGVVKKAQQATKGSERRKELETYSALLRYEINRLQAEYEALKAELEARGDIIRSAVITRYAMAMIEEELQAASQEEDIAFVLMMIMEL